MEVLLPMLAAAAPAAVTAFAIGAARGAGGAIGKATGDAVVGAVGNANNAISGFFSPPQPNPSQGNGQQRVILMTNNGPIY